MSSSPRRDAIVETVELGAAVRSASSRVGPVPEPSARLHGPAQVLLCKLWSRKGQGLNIGRCCELGSCCFPAPAFIKLFQTGRRRSFSDCGARGAAPS